ncbi:MAG: DUF3333 domain-containing protein, partial [Rhodospirillales bacterium]|nr:DUF3333 domain-containing protein [Rhodospirillales bacterium]
MTDHPATSENTGGSIATKRKTSLAVENSLKRRYAAEKRFRLYGIAAIAFA